jgi:hypothetical protein
MEIIFLLSADCCISYQTPKMLQTNQKPHDVLLSKTVTFCSSQVTSMLMRTSSTHELNKSHSNYGSTQLKTNSSKLQRYNQRELITKVVDQAEVPEQANWFHADNA